MELDNLTVDLVKELEYIIENKVYNENTKNPDGEEDGRMIRYPCSMRDPKDEVCGFEGLLKRYFNTEV